jgi:predicted amidohydrolase
MDASQKSAHPDRLNTRITERLRVRAVQHALKRGAPAYNQNRIRELLGEGTRTDRPTLIVLPELFSTGFIDSDYSPDAQKTSTEDRAFLSQLARNEHSYVLGSTLGPSQSAYANLSLLYSPEGHEILTYQKIHPFSFGGEDKYFSPGKDLALADLPGGKICPTICYDLRFPEFYRAGAAAGATLFTVQANWPETRHEHWDILVKARAIENQAFVIAVNCVGEQPPLRYLGGSVILDPRGKILAELNPDQEGILEAELEWSAVTRWRRAFSAFQDRKPSEFWFPSLPE